MVNHKLPSRSIQERDVILAYLPGNSQAFLNRIKVYLEAKERLVDLPDRDMNLHQTRLESVRAGDPDDIQALLELAVLYEVQNELAKATNVLEDICEKLVANKQDCPDIYRQLGTLYEYQGENGEALEVYREACKKWAEGGLKLRPAICLRRLPPSYHDFLVCGISSQITRRESDFDVVVGSTIDSVNLTAEQSVIRLGFLGRVGTREVVGHIGSISVPRHRLLLKKLSEYLVK